MFLGNSRHFTNTNAKGVIVGYLSEMRLKGASSSFYFIFCTLTLVGNLIISKSI